ncbi:MAG: EAL domain-containing protein [Pseudomonadota bacterium]
MEIGVCLTDLEQESACEKRLDPGDGTAFAAALSRLRALSARKDEKRVDVLQRLDLTVLKAHFGENWWRVRSRALVMQEEIVERELQPDDRFFWASDTELYIIRVNGNSFQFEDDLYRLIRRLAVKICGSAQADRQPSGEQVVVDLASDFEGVDAPEHIAERFTLHQSWAGDKALLECVGKKGELILRYQPTMHFAKSLIGVHHAVPLIHYPDGRTEPAASARDEHDDDQFDAELDRWMLNHVDDMIALRDPPVRCGIVLPVQIKTMTRRSLRDHYLERCQKLSQESRHRLVFLLMGVPSGMPQPRIRDLTTYLRPHCMAIGVDQSHGSIAMENLENTGVRLVSLDAHFEDQPEQAESHVRAFIARARAARLRSFIYNLDNVHLSHTAVRAGVTYFNGQAFMHMIAKPSRIMRVKRHIRM